MRTLETARPMLSAANTGITAAIDQKGKIIAELPPFTTASLNVTLAGREITYGLERLAMALQKVNSVYDLVWTEWEKPTALSADSSAVGSASERYKLHYRDVFHQNEVEQSAYNFDYANVPALFAAFNHYESEALHLMGHQLVLPAYEMILQAGHTFNLLDARNAISVTERASYIGRIRALSRQVAQAYYDS
ncbi:hypothetical protein BGZ81_000715, partial [Podila clonocystis]